MPLDAAWTAAEVTPGWTVADHVGHIAAWFDEAAAALEEHRRSGTWREVPPEGIDAWNDDAGPGALAGPRRPSCCERSRPATAACAPRSRRCRTPTGSIPEGFSWAYEDLHGHVRAHLAIIGPYAATVGWPRRVTGADDAARGSAASERRGRSRRTAGLTIEQIVAIESPREFRLQPRDRFVAYTADAAGARQLFVLPLRGGYPIQLTASEKNVADPQWSPDGRRLAYVRDNEIRVIEADGSRDVGVTGHPAGVSAPRWSPDGRRLAFISRRRGWSQVWVVDAPVPRRGRPARDPRPPEPRRSRRPASTSRT